VAIGPAGAIPSVNPTPKGTVKRLAGTSGDDDAKQQLPHGLGRHARAFAGEREYVGAGDKASGKGPKALRDPPGYTICLGIPSRIPEPSMRGRRRLAVLGLIAAAWSCRSPTSATIESTFTLTITGPTSCPALVPSHLEFSMRQGDSESEFTLKDDQQWTAAAGVASLALRLPLGGTAQGQLSGGVSPRSSFGNEWFIFRGSVTATRTRAGELQGSILYNRLSPGALSATCTADPGWSWSLQPTASVAGNHPEPPPRTRAFWRLHRPSRLHSRSL